MLDKIIDAPQSLWLLAFAIYAIDVLRRIAPGYLLLLERRGNQYTPTLARTPFEFGSKELYGPGLLMPWRGVLIARWSNFEKHGVSLAEADRIRHAVLPLRVVSVLNFALLFIGGPMLTSFIGLGGALLIIGPIVYLINGSSGAFAIMRRDRLNLTRGQSWWLLADALLCAPYGANWVKRIFRLQPPLALQLSEPSVFSQHDASELARVLKERREEAVGG